MSNTTTKFSTEVRARAVRMVLDHESDHPSRWEAATSVAANIGCSPPTLREWVNKAEVDSDKRGVAPAAARQDRQHRRRGAASRAQVVQNPFDMWGAIRFTFSCDVANAARS